MPTKTTEKKETTPTKAEEKTKSTTKAKSKATASPKKKATAKKVATSTKSNKPQAKTTKKSTAKPATKPKTKAIKKPSSSTNAKKAATATEPAAKATEPAKKPQAKAKATAKATPKPATKPKTKAVKKPSSNTSAKKPSSRPSTKKGATALKPTANTDATEPAKTPEGQDTVPNNAEVVEGSQPAKTETSSATPQPRNTASQTKSSPQKNRQPASKKSPQKPNAQQKNHHKPATKAQQDAPLQNKQQSQTQPVTANQEYKLLINADSPEECRVALLEKGKLTSFHVETVVNAQNKGNIYKGKVVSVEANLQAAFIDIGTGKNAFLAFSEIHPEYYATEKDQDRHWKDLNIKKVVHEGQELLVEVVKEVTGNKGANMTTHLSLPGRYVVLMIGSNSKGISRQIDNREQRDKLREMLESCQLPEGVGYIIRTASKNITKKALTTDVQFLINLWKDIKEKGQSLPPASLVYQEQNIVARFLRDHFTENIQEILVDSQDAYTQVVNFLELLPAAQRKKTSAKLHRGPRPLLNSFNVEEQIEQIYQPTVKLPSGGSIVINPTEALVAIDVNSGRTDKNSNFEETIFLANMEAAEELARQLQLRDLGGLIVVDFIDMRSNAHIREVEKKVKACMKRDKAKVDFCRISKFGLMQISRQKMAAPVMAGNYKTCEHCQGRGIVKSVETQALVYLRQIQTGVTKRQVTTVQCHLPLEVGHYLLNKKRAELGQLERRYKTAIVIEMDNDMTPSQGKIQFVKE